MSTIEGKILVRNNTHEFHIEKKNPSHLKGILYGAAGFAGATAVWNLTKLAASNLAGAAAAKLFLKEEFLKFARETIEKIPTGLCKTMPATPKLAAINEHVCGPVASYIDPILYESKSFLSAKLRNYIPANVATLPYALAGIGLTALAANYFAIKFTGFCFSKAATHFGPKYEVIKGGEVSKDKWTVAQRKKLSY